MNFFHSIKFRFTIWYLAVLLILLLLLGTGVYLNLSRTLRKDLDEALKARAAQLVSIRHIVDMIERGRFEENVGETIVFYFRSGPRLIQVSPRNQTLPVTAELSREVMDGNTLLTTLSTSDGTPLRIFAIPYRPRPENLRPPPEIPPPEALGAYPLRPGRRGPPPRPPEAEMPLPGIEFEGPAALFVARSTENIEKALGGLLGTLFIAIPLTLLIAGAGGVFLASRVLTPVDEITEAARNIEEKDLGKRIEVHTNDELGKLASTLNEMIERLQNAFERQKQFTGDASHELRTPLAVIVAESTLALQRERSREEYRKSLETVARESENMSGIIDQLLKLARADAGMETFSFGEVDLGDVAASIVSEAERPCSEKGLNLQSDLKSGIMLTGDRAMLGLLFSNLINNAVTYTPEGGGITVTVRKDGDSAIARISDTGIGIPSGELPHIFDRFYRVDKARSRAEGGSGLGLAICKQIVELHGGNISVESDPGQGTTFTVKL